MSENEDKSSKTEEPSERKLRKAREKGDVPSSRETGNMMSVFALFVLTLFILPQAGPQLAGALRGVFESAGQIGVGEGRQGLADLGAVVRALGRAIALALAPALLVMIVAAIFGVLIQGETVVSLDRIRPKLSKLSPLSGLKKMFSADSFVEFAKNVAKVLVVAVIAVWVARGAVTGIWQSRGFVPEELPGYLRGEVAKLLIAATVFLVPVAVIDIVWKRMQWIKKQRMSLKELRDEHKESEGDPMVRMRRAEIRRKRARQRVAQAVPTASVVLTNPTHYAVALRYQPGVDTAPVCVAKGTDLMAAQIRRLARENDIPLVENRPLARALHASVEVDDQIPVEHWQAVAEIIGYVMDLRRNIRRRPPSGSSLRVAE
ncbi:flagellar biosynthesis protein FlhB [Actibacterium sp. MT2.3-13A]|uniref:flagellar biosynthesis protein FlhB n=1 Tax=Actibacterium sp. MT2.3-13A TaxID=2828332 RepID=UPI001BA8002C|nr:flagellar biosynthesis protein FlhB [Actibacterium sp. MT2.3-13A]